MARRDGSPGVARNFLSGVAILGQGFRVWGTAPRIMLLGIIPALIVGAVFVALIVVFGTNLERIAGWITPFAEGWDEPFRVGIRFLAGFGLLAVALVVLVYTFTAVTLAVGDPFYESIWRHVEARDGTVPDAGVKGFWRSFGRGLGDALRLVIPALLIGIGIFAVGFIPIVGQLLGPVLGATVGGWFLTLELTGRAFDARGATFAQRRQALGAQRATTLGFGVATYLLFLIPLGAVVTMPAAVAGATMLARRATPAIPIAIATE